MYVSGSLPCAIKASWLVIEALLTRPLEGVVGSRVVGSPAVEIDSDVRSRSNGGIL